MQHGIKDSAAKPAAGRSRKLSAVLALTLAVLLVFACTAAAFAKGADSSAPAGDTTTIGASQPTGAQDGSGQENSESQEGSGESEAELERRKEIYTIGAMITLGAIFVGLRERRRR